LTRLYAFSGDSQERMMNRNAEDPLEARVIECLKTGGEMPDDVRGWLLDVRRQHEPLGKWDGVDVEAFWPAFFFGAVQSFTPGSASLRAHLAGFFRGTPAYKAWARQVAVEPERTWSPEASAEIHTWPDGRLADARIAAWLTNLENDKPDVKLWVDRFNVKAIAHAARFGHPLAAASDLVGDFWLWVFEADPPRVFSRYSPPRAALFNFAFRCFDHEFREWGQQAAIARAREVADNATLAREESPAAPVDALDPDQVETARLVWAQQVSRRVRACLGELGTQVGKPGWLLWQVQIEQRSYKDLVAELAAQGDNVVPNALRQRALQARRKFDRLWVAEAGAWMLPYLPKGKETITRSFDMTDEDAVRLVRALEEEGPHPSDEELIGSAYGDLANADCSRVDAHLATCEGCRDDVAHLRDTLAFLQTPEGKTRLGQLWNSFREATARMQADGRSGESGGFAAAAARTHEQYVRSTGNGTPSSSWSSVPEDFKRSNYHQIAYAPHILATVRLALRPLTDREDRVDDMVQALGLPVVRGLAELEHERFVAERVMQDWHFGPVKDVSKKVSPYLVPWKDLSAQIQELDVDAVKSWPATFREVGLEIYRVNG
jgi:hypothetical protein